MCLISNKIDKITGSEPLFVPNFSTTWTSQSSGTTIQHSKNSNGESAELFMSLILLTTTITSHSFRNI